MLPLRQTFQRAGKAAVRSDGAHSKLNALTRHTARHCIQQHRNFYISGPLIIVPGLIAFFSITIYQVYKKQQRDEQDAIKYANKIQWRAKDIVYYGRKYSKREESDEVYDYNSYQKALKFPDEQPVLIGHWAVGEDGKQYIKLLEDSKSSDDETIEQQKS
mmetsp:Transcript_9060/g.15320  ORF Transcript_9060/g.15320 Transcript_9060/m.15320 type:complete len:160 (-) Transcript_9060:78-557(-)